MPTLVKKERRNGGLAYEIRFSLNRERKTLSLGQRKDASTIFEMVSRLLEVREDKINEPPYLTAWKENLDNDLYLRLEKLGLVDCRRQRATFRIIYDQWTDYPVDRKPNTIANHATAYARVLDFFNEDRLLETITAEEALRFKQFLQNRGYAPATIDGVFRKIKAWYSLAEKSGLVQSNPFSEVRTNRSPNPERRVYVRPEWYPRLLEACPNQTCRTLISLSRIGGLRVDSETRTLRWSYVDFEKNLVTIRSPKTERFEGREQRVIPLFPELRTELERQRAITGELAYVLPDCGCHANVYNTVIRIIGRAGLVPWPKPFNNMRASREMDLLESFPAHVVAAWLGHSTITERKYYVYAREEDYERGATYTKS